MSCAGSRILVQNSSILTGIGNVRHHTSLQEMDDHNIAEDVKVTPILKHNYEEHALAQQTGQILPA